MTSPITAGGAAYSCEGRFAPVDSIVVLPSTVLAAGQTLGAAIELGERRELRLELLETAKSGTSPTLDVTLQHSPDGLNGWRTLGSAFTQRTGSGTAYTMGAVTSAGTTPPTVTLTGTVTKPIHGLRVECTTLGARGTSKVRYSIDGGLTWVSDVTTAATVSVVDANGTATGLVLNFATGDAAVDNVWAAVVINREKKAFSGCDRFVRAVCTVGGTDTPTVTAQITGEL